MYFVEPSDGAVVAETLLKIADDGIADGRWRDLVKSTTHLTDASVVLVTDRDGSKG